MDVKPLPYRTALITGASSGLGRGLAVWFASRGVHVFGAARREQELSALADECQKAGGILEPVHLDAADAAQTTRRLGEIDASCGGLDLVIANAGVGLETSARRMKWEDVERTIQVNVTGMAATICAVLPGMVERNRGHLVAISSLAGYRGMPKMAAYSASKAFVRTFLESLRVDLQGTKVKVTSIQPGFVKSEMTAKNRFPMPFLLETREACEKMAQAILRQDASYDFPWQMSAAMKLVRALPHRLYGLAARRLK